MWAKLGVATTMLIATLSGCAELRGVIRDPVTRQTELGLQLAQESADWSVTDVSVQVPDALEVSERNVYYPFADIVWREEPLADRKAQVARIIDEGVTAGLSHLSGPEPVRFDITLARFHSLTEKARYSIGGVHNIVFDIKITDQRSGVVLHDALQIVVELNAYGGGKAIGSERLGLTQRKRIRAHLMSEMSKLFSGGQSFETVPLDVLALRPLPGGR